MRRLVTYTAAGLGAATCALGLVTVALSLVGHGEARPELVTGGAALMLATNLIGNGNSRKGNRRADTRRRKRL